MKNNLIQKKCHLCNGDGWRIIGWGHRVICYLCNGKGYVVDKKNDDKTFIENKLGKD